jgi:hypothetical protein
MLRSKWLVERTRADSKYSIRNTSRRQEARSLRNLQAAAPAGPHFNCKAARPHVAAPARGCDPRPAKCGKFRIPEESPAEAGGDPTNSVLSRGRMDSAGMYGYLSVDFGVTFRRPSKSPHARLRKNRDQDGILMHFYRDRKERRGSLIAERIKFRSAFYGSRHRCLGKFSCRSLGSSQRSRKTFATGEYSLRAWKILVNECECRNGVNRGQ